MDEKVQWLKGQIEDWKQNKIIDKRTANKILSFYSDQKPVEHKNKTPLILSVIAAILISAGLISLIAYNWVAIGRGVKTVAAFVVAMLPALLIFIPMAAPEKFKILDKAIIKEFISFLWVVMCGASMEFLAQIYLLPLSWEVLFLLWFSVSLIILFCTRCKGVYALTVVLFICATYSYLSLCILVTVFFLYSNYLLKNNQKYDRIIYPVVYSLLAFGFFMIIFTEQDKLLICTILEAPYMAIQAVLLVIGSCAGLVHSVFSVRKIKENKTLFINVVETITCLCILAILLLIGFFANADINTYKSVLEILLVTFMISATAKVIYFKNYKWVPFIAAGILFLIILGFDFLEWKNIFGPYFIFLCICLGMFLQNTQGRKKPMTLQGKLLFAFALFIAIFEIYEPSSSSYSCRDSFFNTKFLSRIFYNFGLLYSGVFGILRPLLVSIKNRKSVNYVIPVFGLIVLIYLFIIQFTLYETIITVVDVGMPLVALISVVVFSVIEIIDLFKKDSIAGINLTAVYLLVVSFVKFFMTTNSLILRGIAFILCGIIVLVINLVLSKCLKKKEVPGEE